MDIQEIGEVLKNERINQGLSWEDVYDKTKISPYVLQHIEEGILEDLPHPVYVKGFIKCYASFLGLESEELGREFAKSLSLEEEDNKDKIQSTSSSGQKAKFLLAVFLLLLLIAGWFVFKGVYLQSLDNASKTGYGVENSTNATEAQTRSKNSTAAANASSERGREFNGTESLQSIMDKNNTGADNSSAGNATDMDKTSHVMTVDAEEACWLLAEIDGETRDVYLRSGETLDLRFRDSLTLKLGNAGGVKLLYDGEDYPLQAESGEVKIINLP